MRDRRGYDEFVPLHGSRSMIEDERNSVSERRATFPSQSSILDQDALLPWAALRYAAASVESCEFLSRGDADIYRVVTTTGCHDLNVYRPPRRRAHAEAEVRFFSMSR